MLTFPAAGPEIRRILWTAIIFILQQSASCPYHGSDKFGPNRNIYFIIVLPATP
jgi:hypothetical protein